MTTIAEEIPKTSSSPAAVVAAPKVAAPDRAELAERARIDASTKGPVLAFFGTAIVWLMISTLLRLIASIKLHWPEFLSQFSIFTYGRIYPAYTNSFIYGWGCLAGMGVAIWLMARLCKVAIRAPGVLVYGALFWNIGVGFGVAGILFGGARPFDSLEMPKFAHILMFIGFMLIGLWGAVMYRYRAHSHSYISVWYLLGALFWFPWIFVLANVLLSTHEVSGVMQAIVSAWYAQNLEGWWFTAIGLAAAYFFIPKVINQPVYSYSLATLGFWTFAFFSGLTGMVRLSGGPVPVWLVTFSIASSIMMLVPVTTVTVNLLATIRNHFDSVFHSPTMRFTVFGTVSFALASLLGILTSPRSVDSIVHFTPLVQGHQQLVLYSFFTMIMFGAIYYITPRLVGCEWLSSSLISIHFLAVAYGGSLAAATLIFAGLAQGLTLSDPTSTFTQIFGIAEVYNPGHTIACFLVAIGHTVFALHFLLMLLRIGQPAGEATLFSTEESH